jgi:3-oxoacyl-[acyl-carrier-protein] synthase II
LTPTYFIQSTYNALSGLIALTLKCKGYNNTYVNRGFAFETCLHDAMMQLNANPSSKILAGGYDERDDAQYKIHMRVNYYKHERINNLELFKHDTIGTLQGEASAFFLLAARASAQTWCELLGVKMIYCPEDVESLSAQVQKFLTSNQLSFSDIDVVVSGESGDVKNDYLIRALNQREFGKIPVLRYKHLSGEYCTASSFGLWLGASVLKKQQIPNVVTSHALSAELPVKVILAVNQYMGKNYSLMLLRGVE